MGRKVQVWDVATGMETHSLVGHTNTVSSVAFSPDDKVLASCGGDRLIKLWDVTSGGEIATLIGHKETVSCVTFSGDGKLLASSGYDKSIKLWDVVSFGALKPATHRRIVTSRV